jgi:hypothetical protein
LTCFGHTVCVGFQRFIASQLNRDVVPKIKPPTGKVPTVFDTPPANKTQKTCRQPKVLRHAELQIPHGGLILLMPVAA